MSQRIWKKSFRKQSKPISATVWFYWAEHTVRRKALTARIVPFTERTCNGRVKSPPFLALFYTKFANHTEKYRHLAKKQGVFFCFFQKDFFLSVILPIYYWNFRWISNLNYIKYRIILVFGELFSWSMDLIDTELVRAFSLDPKKIKILYNTKRQ